jgi:diguanylate cyclase (GGDEF)-like protein
MSRHARIRMLLLAAILGIVGLVWLAATLQHGVATTRGERLSEADQLLVATLEEEVELLAPGHGDGTHRVRAALGARERYEDALSAAEAETEGVPSVVSALDAFTSLHERWERLADAALDRPAAAHIDDGRAELIDRMTEAGTRLRVAIAREQDADQGTLTLAFVVLTGVLLLLIGGVGAFVAARRERRRRREEAVEDRIASGQAEFGHTLQLVGDEVEAHELVKRHLERAVPSGVVTVLNRNNSANRLEATTEPPEGSTVAELLAEGVEPRACVATRLGRLHERAPGEEPLLGCDLCGAEAGATTCAPLLVSGEVIGAVLVSHEQPLDAPERRRVTDSVVQASPVIGNLRNLAIAETRAATDALTGLPNRRALQDTVRRMVAQAGRTLEPLAAVALDLDHFKQINDRFGHDKGDDVLAAVGPLLADSLRDSDFAARAGGEEFCILLPGTDEAGATEVAEKLRVAISRIDVPGVDRQITGSFGIAAYPSQAVDAPTLLRKADRALYLAKERGRDRVEVAAAVPAADARS